MQLVEFGNVKNTMDTSIAVTVSVCDCTVRLCAAVMNCVEGEGKIEKEGRGRGETEEKRRVVSKVICFWQ